MTFNETAGFTVYSGLIKTVAAGGARASARFNVNLHEDIEAA